MALNALIPLSQGVRPGATREGDQPQGIQGSLVLDVGRGRATGAATSAVPVASAHGCGYIRFANADANGVVTYFDLYIGADGKVRVSTAAVAIGDADPLENAGTVVGGQS